MEIQVRKASPLKAKTGCLVLGMYEKGLGSSLTKELNQQLGGLLRQAQQSGQFTGKLGEHILFQPTDRLAADRVLIVGLGKKASSSIETLRQASGNAMQQILKIKLKNAVFALPLNNVQKGGLTARIQATAEGILLSSYRYDRFLKPAETKSQKGPSRIILLIEDLRDKRPCEAALDRTQKLCRAVALSRDLVNAPGNIKSPAFLVEQAQQAAEESSLRCTALDRAELTQEGFGALLGVAQGSQREPYLIVLEHKGGDTKAPPVALVGKGVVFDAGGISLKPAEKMDEMKMDMAGGAAVIGAMLAASLLKLPINVIGLVPTVENLPSGTAYRPGDILTSLSGQTVEVLNTDAEGRLILADALTYAKRFKPQAVIDVATLTGACIIALGHQATAILGNDQNLVNSLVAAGLDCGERLWQLPLWEEYEEQIKSSVADMKNVGGRPAGTITAAAFLKKFAGEFRWAHLDIAGTAWRDKDQPYIPKGGTGVGVRLLINFLQELCNSPLS